MDKDIRKATLFDVAKKADVSISAVSLVLNNKKGVGDETRKRILSALNECNYYKIKPGQIRRRSNGHFLFLKYIKHGLVVNENPGFIASIQDAIANACDFYGFNLFVRNMTDDTLLDDIHTIDNAFFDGVFLVGTELDAVKFEQIRQIPVPIVVVDNAMRNISIDSVVMANHNIVNQSMNYLYSIGHREIGYLKSNMPIANFIERSEGYWREIHNLNLPNLTPIYLTPTINGAYESMIKHMHSESFKLPKAYFADNDAIAIGAMQALQENEISIPKDVSIIGIDDVSYSSYTNPKLSTVHIPTDQIGRTSVQVMYNRINSPDEMPSRTMVFGRLVIRDSCSPILHT